MSRHPITPCLAVLFWIWLSIPSPAFCPTTPIHIDTEPGGNIDVGTAAEWDGVFENTHGAMFWNGSAWVTNDTAAHSYFTDLRTGQRLKEHQVVTIDNDPLSGGAFSPVTGYVFEKSTYRYTAARSASAPSWPSGYGYEALQYYISQPDGTHILLRSRGTGNGIAAPYFDLFIEDGNGSTTAMRGDPVWYTYQNSSAREAAAVANDSDVASGILATYSSTNVGLNRYWMDINGGSDMGGVTYLLVVGTIEASRVLAASLGKPFVTEFHIEYTDATGTIEELLLTPALVSETAAVYSDSFSPKLFQPLNWRKLRGTWIANKKGFYSCSGKQPCLAIVTSAAASSATAVSARIYLEPKAVGPSGSLVFAVKNKTIYRSVTLAPNLLVIGQSGKIGKDRTGTKGTAKIKARTGKWYTVKATMLPDGSVQVALNGKLVGGAKFKSLASGGVGVGSPGAAARFDDFAAERQLGAR